MINNYFSVTLSIKHYQYTVLYFKCFWNVPKKVCFILGTCTSMKTIVEDLIDVQFDFTHISVRC